jgi:phospholipase A1
MPASHYRFLPLLPLLVLNSAMAQQAATSAAASSPVNLADCARIAEASPRLVCYDRLAGASTTGAKPETDPGTVNNTVARAGVDAGAATVSPSKAPPVQTDPAVEASLDLSPETTRGFSLDDYWELDQAHKRGVFNFRPHNVNYLMVTRTAHPNDEPYQPFRNISDLASGLSHNELVFQLSFKMKMIEGAFNKPLDLWFGYTQNSFWQAGNHKASSPFRETNYQPELMLVTPLDFNLLGVRARMLGFGVVHQSNGQASTLSRSWNRYYAQLGVERGGWTVNGRIWKRINETASDDNNPDIVKYMGHGDATVTYRNNGNEYSALLRRNFSTDRGAVQLSWAFPLAGHIKGYTQYFSGYGQSLIDYNYYQNSLGLGVQGTF